jgi:HD-GYP domain-containing protein (c-di-GMP phosphodiesterase class II)/DNA-binding CsgD family transcriptional regulator
VADVRLADLLAGLSRFADLGFGLPAGAALRSCVLATRLARSLDLPAADVRAAFYTALLHHVGCAGYAHETARLFGDELVANRAAGRTDAASGRDLIATFLPTLTRGRPAVERARLTLAALTKGGRWGEAFTTTACEVGRDTARRLHLPEEVQVGLFHVYDLWRGKGGPRARHGDDIPIGARIARLTGIAVLFESIGGIELAVHAVRRRSAGMLDPGLVAHFADQASEWLTALDETDTRDVVLDLEPLPAVTVPGVRLVAEVFADLVDLKSPYLLGHSRSVAALAGGAAERLRMPADTARDLAMAGLLHDVGRVAVSNAVWDKPGRLSTEDWEQVRLHPYQSERILASSAELARLGPLVGRHHERLDGTGYHRGSGADDLSAPARVLAAADRYRTLIEDRPHRPALAPEQAGQRLLDESSRGALDADAVHAVLAAAGHTVPAPRRSRPDGLSDREVEVLGLLARGCSNAEIAARLVISRRTAEHHVQHIYTKIGVSSRAAATLFAVEHDLLDRR